VLTSPLGEGKRIEGKRKAFFIQPRGVSEVTGRVSFPTCESGNSSRIYTPLTAPPDSSRDPQSVSSSEERFGGARLPSAELK